MYTSNDEIEISLDHKEAESKGNEILDAYNDSIFIMFKLSNLLPKFGFKLDDNGNKFLVNENDPDIKGFHEPFLTLTHPYIFEFVWYSSIISFEKNQMSLYFYYGYKPISEFNRKDILQVIYESSETPEGINRKNEIFGILKRNLKYSIENGNYQIIEYLTRIGTKLDTISAIDFNNVFQIKEEDFYYKKNRILDYLYHNKVEIYKKYFDHEALEGRYENIRWYVEHGYQGKNAILELERLQERTKNQQRVLDFLRANNPKWKSNDNSVSSSGNYDGKPMLF